MLMVLASLATLMISYALSFIVIELMMLQRTDSIALFVFAIIGIFTTVSMALILSAFNVYSPVLMLPLLLGIYIGALSSQKLHIVEEDHDVY